MVERGERPGEYRWGLAWGTVALLAFGVFLLFFPHARWFGIVILGGYLLLVKHSLRRVSWSRDFWATNNTENRGERREPVEDGREAE
jgi:hypothetical protein